MLLPVETVNRQVRHLRAMVDVLHSQRVERNIPSTDPLFPESVVVDACSRLRSLETVLPNSKTEPPASSIYNFGEWVADYLEQRKFVTAEIVFGATCLFFTGAMEKAVEPPAALSSDREVNVWLQVISARLHTTALNLISLQILKALQYSLPGPLYHNVIGRFATLGVEASSWKSVGALRDHYKKIAKMQGVIWQLCPTQRTACSSPIKLGSHPGFQVEGEGLYLAITRYKVLPTTISIWTPLGNFPVWSGYGLSENHLSDIVSRFQLQPATPQFAPPFWDTCSTLYAFGVDSEGIGLPNPSQNKAAVFFEFVAAAIFEKVRANHTA